MISAQDVLDRIAEEQRLVPQQYGPPTAAVSEILERIRDRRRESLYRQQYEAKLGTKEQRLARIFTKIKNRL